jgi:DNA-binding transcriptional LysR family regulator
MPHRPSDLDDHRLITYGAHGKTADRQSEWLLEAGSSANRRRQPILQLDNIVGALAAVEGGLGIGVFPPFAVPAASRLIRIMPDQAAPDAIGYFVYPSEARRSKRMSVFRDFILQKLSDEAGFSP